MNTFIMAKERRVTYLKENASGLREKHSLPAYTELRSLYKTCWMNAN